MTGIEGAQAAKTQYQLIHRTLYTVHITLHKEYIVHLMAHRRGIQLYFDVGCDPTYKTVWLQRPNFNEKNCNAKIKYCSNPPLSMFPDVTSYFSPPHVLRT